MTSRGRVAGLHRWPVKSLAGESLHSADVGPDGLAGDRVHAFLDVEGARAGKLLTARQAPGLLAWTAGYPDHPDDALPHDAVPPAEVRAPGGGRWRWGDEGLAAAVAEAAGRAVTLRRDPSGQPDCPGLILVTVEASRRAAEAELGAPLDLRRFRSNVHLELDAPAFAEEQWTGAELRVGDGLHLCVSAPCRRCAMPSWDPDGAVRWPALLEWLVRDHANVFGVYVRVDKPGVVKVGDPVEVVAASPAPPG